MGSLCFDTWLAHSDGTIIQDHEADFESGYLISALIQITQRSVSPLKCGYRKLSWLCDPHLVTQLSQVDGLGPSCPTIFAALCFLQRSETGQCTVGPWGPLQTGRFRDVQGGDLQRGYHGHLLWHARLHCSGGELCSLLKQLWESRFPSSPIGKARPSRRCSLWAVLKADTSRLLSGSLGEWWLKMSSVPPSTNSSPKEFCKLCSGFRVCSWMRTKCTLHLSHVIFFFVSTQSFDPGPVW